MVLISDDDTVMTVRMINADDYEDKNDEDEDFSIALQDFLLCADFKKQTWLLVPSGALWYVMGSVMLNINCRMEFTLSFQHKRSQSGLHHFPSACISSPGACFQFPFILSLTLGMSALLMDRISHLVIQTLHHHVCIHTQRGLS